MIQDVESLNGIRGYERATILQDLSMDGGNMHDREHAPLFMSDRIWDHIKAAFSLLGHLSLLRRLTDGNNPEAAQSRFRMAQILSFLPYDLHGCFIELGYGPYTIEVFTQGHTAMV